MSRASASIRSNIDPGATPESASSRSRRARNLASAIRLGSVSTAAVGYALNAVTEIGLVACLILGAIVATTGMEH